MLSAERLELWSLQGSRIQFFSSTPLHPPAIRISTIAPYVAPQLITQEKLAEDEA